MVRHYFDIQLEKGPQTANWGLRPLTTEMERYAFNDVLHLMPLAKLLRERLEALGRLSWWNKSVNASSTRPVSQSLMCRTLNGVSRGAIGSVEQALAFLEPSGTGVRWRRFEAIVHPFSSWRMTRWCAWLKVLPMIFRGGR